VLTAAVTSAFGLQGQAMVPEVLVPYGGDLTRPAIVRVPIEYQERVRAAWTLCSSLDVVDGRVGQGSPCRIEVLDHSPHLLFLVP